MSLPFGLISAFTPNGAVAPVTDSFFESADKKEGSGVLDTRLSRNQRITFLESVTVLILVLTRAFPPDQIWAKSDFKTYRSAGYKARRARYKVQRRALNKVKTSKLIDDYF